MPSKTKKQSKSALKPSLSDHSASPQNSSSLIPVPELGSEEDLLRSLEEATERYPSLINKSAIIGRITGVKAESKGCRIWLSESSMVASSISPGCTVSVSLAAPKRKFSCTFPLCSLVDECAKHYGFDFSGKIVTDVGSYFALATVFPSCKVLKNEVQLSSNLFNTLGCPDSGRTIFICPIQSKSALSVNGTGKSYRPSANCLSLSKCRELYLELVSSQCGLVKSTNLSPDVKFPGERTPNRSENGMISSPMTPVHSQSKLNSHVTSQSSSQRCEEHTPSFPRSNGTYFDSFSMTDLLKDDGSKKLLQSCATSWLSSRSLLFGNFVTVPVLSKICIFQVLGAIGESANFVDQHLVDTFNQDSFSEASGPADKVAYAFTVNHETKVTISPPLNSTLETPRKGLPRLGFADMKDEIVNDTPKLGGLSNEYTALKEIIVSSLVKTRLGSRRVKGVLLHGPPGVGKTSLAKKCVLDSGINLVTVNGSQIVSEYSGGSELALQELFRSASEVTPSVVFIDELDAIDMSQTMVATLSTMMETDGTLVIAATSQPDKIEPALRKHGRLEKDIEIGVPSPKQRYDILLVLLSEMKHSLSDIQVQHIASTTHGFVGADLTGLCNEAAMTCFKRCLVWMKSATPEFDCPQNNSPADSDCPEDGSTCSQVADLPVSSQIENTVEFRVNGASLDKESILVVSFEDFEVAKARVRPSSMREVMLEVPKVGWEDVGGQREVKMQLREAVEWPQKYPDAFQRIGIRPPTGVLMFGPPGCSKTLLARAVASEAGLNFLAVKGPELFSQWVGESEKAVRSLFAKARENAPSIIFFDEIDSLAVIRGKENDELSVGDRVMSQLLVEMDGFQQRGNVTVIAATNRPDKIDSALLRPGRFDRLLYVGPPSEIDRQDIFAIHLRRMSCSSDVCIKELAFLTEGYTGADISLICLVAGYAAIEGSVEATEVKMEHLKAAIEKVEPSETKSYQELLMKFQRGAHSSAQLDGLADQPPLIRSSSKTFWQRRTGLAFRRDWLMKSFTVLAVCSAWLCLRLQPSIALNWYA